MSNIITCGRREEGKTTLALYLARQKHRCVIVFDPRAMISGVPVYSADELEDALDEKAWNDGAIVYRFEGDDNEAFDEMSSVIFPPYFTRGGFSLVVDESGRIQNSHSINKEFVRAIKQAPTEPPREAVDIIQTNHRLTEFNGGCKALINELYIFQTTYKTDLDTLEAHTGLAEMSEIVKKLPRHHCVRYFYGRRDDDDQYEVWDNPLIWFNDIKRNTTLRGEPAPEKPKEGWFV